MLVEAGFGKVHVDQGTKRPTYIWRRLNGYGIGILVNGACCSFCRCISVDLWCITIKRFSFKPWRKEWDEVDTSVRDMMIP